MNIRDIANLLNFGLLVLTWMVQLIVYPGLQYYNLDNLAKWHQAYTPAISIIVIPLMFGQLFISGYLVFSKTSFLNIAIIVLVVLVWVITFLMAVPAHSKIATNIEPYKQIADLIRINWYRTAVWTVIFILGAIMKYKIDGNLVE